MGLAYLAPLIVETPEREFGGIQADPKQLL
jgi:hypothetical protein